MKKTELIKIIKEEVNAVLIEQTMDRQTVAKLIKEPDGERRLGDWFRYIDPRYANPDPVRYPEKKTRDKFKLVYKAALYLKNWLTSPEPIPPAKQLEISRALKKAAETRDKLAATIDFYKVLSSQAK